MSKKQANGKAKAAEPRILSTGIETLPVTLPDAAILAYASELAGLSARFDALDAEEQTSRDGYKARRSELKSDSKRLSAIISGRVEMRRIAVRVVADDARRMARVIREDTGECVSERSLTPEESQLMLPGEPVPSGIDQRIESMEHAATQAKKASKASAPSFCGDAVCGHGNDLHEDGEGKCGATGCACQSFVAGGKAEAVAKDS